MLKRELATFLIFSFILATIPDASCISSSPIIYVAGDGSGDYNCNATDANLQINEALKFVAGNSSYTTVHLKGPFTYVVNDTLLIGNNTILEGDSTAVVKLASHADWPTMKPLIQQMSPRGNNNITIRGFEVNANYEGNSETLLGRGFYNVMYLVRCNNVTVCDMYMHDGHGDGLRIHQGKNIQFYNNTIDKLGHDGMYAILCENVEAWNNRITCRTNGALRVWNSNKVKLHDNFIDSFHHWSAGGPGIQIEKGPDSSKRTAIVNDLEVYNNTITNSFGPGIWMIDYNKSDSTGDQGKGIRIHNNIFYNTGTNPSITSIGGIVANGFNGTIIENNVFDGCYGAAISLTSPPVYMPIGGFYTTVRNNIIVNTQECIKDPNGTGYAAVNNFPQTYNFVLENNNLYNNAGGDYKNCTSTTDIYLNPLFADQKDHDYHLQSVTGRWNGKRWVKDEMSSPCIDAGYLYSDCSNEPEPNGSRINLGPDGNTMYASKSNLDNPLLICPVAGFNSNVTSGATPLNVAFTDTTAGTPTVWIWSFGDDTYSTVRNPVHTYNKTGKYTVSLTVWNDAGSNTEIKCSYIVVDTAPAQNASPEVNETRITTNVSMKEFPAIYDNRIVWQDYRNGNPGNASWDIYMYDLSTSNETRVTTNESWQENPTIYGDKIVWEDGRNGINDIYMYTISTGEETQITNDESENTHPVIYGDKIVWEERSAGKNHDIYMYTIPTRKEVRITNGKSDNIHPAICGDKIIWEKSSEECHDICMYNISTCKITQITSNGEAYNPAIHGDRIVWEDHRLADKYDLSSSDIYEYDLSTGKETRISTSGRASNSAIYDDRIAWHDFRNGNDDICMYDLSTSREIQITTNISEQEFPALFGDRIVWQDYRDVPYKPNIYVCTIRYPPVASFYASPRSGTVPLTVAFTDKSTGSPTAWSWNFGDETANSTVSNPVHTFNKTGKYTVSLTATNDVGSDLVKKCNYVVVNSLNPPVANFSASSANGKAPLTVEFTDKSTGSPTAWKWCFGDGTSSTDENPVHTYCEAGKYNVTLTVNNYAGSNVVTKSEHIRVSKQK